MAIVLPKSTYLHIPKCGGTWATQAMAAAGLSTEMIPAGDPHTITTTEGRFAFTFVRHPLTWYPSFWKYRWKTAEMQGALIADHLRACARRADETIDTCLVDEAGHPRSFADFVSACVACHPGFLSKKFETYVAKADFVGRQESLCDDLISALHLAGETFDAEVIRSIPRVNETTGKHRADYPPGLAEQVLAVESAAIEKYYSRQSRPVPGRAA